MAKKLLKESTIRRFQKLAKVAPINEMYSQNEEYLNEEEEQEEAPMDMDAELGEEAPMEMDAELGEEDMLELDEEEAKLIISLADKLEAQLGGMDTEGEEEMDAGDEGEEEMGEEEMGEDELMEALRGISYQPSQSEIVNEVARRVAKRLKVAKLHEAKLNRALGKRR